MIFRSFVLSSWRLMIYDAKVVLAIICQRGRLLDLSYVGCILLKHEI